MKLNSLLYAALITIAGVCITSCSKDNEEQNKQEVTDYEQLKESAVQEFIAFAKNPRPGYYHDKALEYLQNVARQYGWKWERDEYGNCWIDVPATKGYEDYPNFILQAHTDMVCAAAEGETYDFKEAVGTPVREGNLLRGEHINLGADNGIGVGMILAIIKSNVGHGPLRCLFTADEETGMLGTQALDNSVINADYMFTIDGEKEGEIINGCPGACLLNFTREFARVQPAEGLTKLTVEISGLFGGHSGVNIGDHRLSAAVAINEILRQISLEHEVMLVSTNVGFASNAIATSGSVSFAIKTPEADDVKNEIQSVLAAFAHDYPEETINRRISQNDILPDDYICEAAAVSQLTELFKEVKYGAFETSPDDPTRVTKSANIGPMTLADGKFTVDSYVRSDFNDWLNTTETSLLKYAENIGFQSKCITKYPAWYSTEVFPMVTMFKQHYAAAIGRPIVETFEQGGIEPTFFSQMHPGIQITCFGPKIDNPHSINETLHIDSIKPLMEAVIKTLQSLNTLKSATN